MTQAKHTPGPWYTHGNQAVGLSVIAPVITGGLGITSNIHVAAVHGSRDDAANAALIAAAPELLASLKTILPHYRKLLGLHDTNTDTEWTTLAHNAIAKAGGAA